MAIAFQLVSEYAISRVQANQEGLKLNGTYQRLVYADDVTILGGSIHAVKKNKEALVVAFERVEEFKYFGTCPTNQNSIHEEIKCRLKSGNACYHSAQNLFSSNLL